MQNTSYKGIYVQSQIKQRDVGGTGDKVLEGIPGSVQLHKEDLGGSEIVVRGGEGTQKGRGGQECRAAGIAAESGAGEAGLGGRKHEV